MRYRVYKILVLVALSFLTANCAKRGKPTGGEKDSIPPLVVHATPNHKSINFKAKKIKISFDEYIKLKDVNNQLVISPPLNNTPIITPVGTASKFINIKILDTLKENTTYTFNFGNSIVDNNEENKLEQFKYVVSTGTYIDSLTLKGTISDSFNQEPDENVSVMLYELNEQYTDSIIFKDKPMYLTSTLDSTIFELSNLKAGKYLLLAIKQPSNSYIYKAKQDKIGFIKDTITLPTDETYAISLFKEVLPFRLSKPKETSKGRILFGFEGNADSLKIKLLDKTPANFKQELLYERDKDTLNYWFNTIEKDSLLFEVSNINFIDTVTVKLRSSKQDTVVLKNNISGTLNLRDTFSLSSNIPLTQVDTSKISLLKDSISIPYSVKIDSFKTKLFINFDKELKSKYTLQFLPKSITDIFENTNDTLSYNFSTKNIEDYGNINISVSNVNSPIIIELINAKKELIDARKITKSEIINFSNLVPAVYIVRAIFDDNNNGVYDTGNFLRKTYSEKIQYLETEEELKVRANWDLNELFILK